METGNPSAQYQSFNFNIITDELKKIAELELNENEGERQVALNTLKDLLKRKHKYNNLLNALLWLYFTFIPLIFNLKSFDYLNLLYIRYYSGSYMFS